jgi:hypothetical protein
MTTSLILGFVWIVVANVLGMLPSRRNHWPQAYALIAVGIPLLGYITYENGPGGGSPRSSPARRSCAGRCGSWPRGCGRRQTVGGWSDDRT